MKSQHHLLTILCSLFILCAQKANCQDSLLDRNLTLTAREASLPEFMHMIEQAGQIKFVYTHNLLPKNYKVNISVQDQSLNRVLESVLGSAGVKWKELNGHIVLFSAPNNTAPPVHNTNLINVINVYDTIISVRYDTIRNQIYDTLLVLQHDTIIHDIYRTIKPQWEIGMSGSLVGWNNYAPVVHASHGTPNRITDNVNFEYAAQALIRLTRNRWCYQMGIGLQQYRIIHYSELAQYTPIFTDTTVQYLETYETYRLEGNTRIVYTTLRAADSSYSFVSDSTLSWVTSSKAEAINYVTLPVFVSYDLLRMGKTRLHAKAGAMINLLTSNTPSAFSLAGMEPIAYSRLYYNYLFGLGIDQYVGERCKIWLDIVGKTPAGTLYKNHAAPHQLESIQVNFGISYCLQTSL